MKRVSVVYKLEPGKKTGGPSKNSCDYKAEAVTIANGFLNITEGGAAAAGRVVHISLDVIASWTEEDS